MVSEIIQIKQIILTLETDEAEWLRAYLQLPFEEESGLDTEMRLRFLRVLS